MGANGQSTIDFGAFPGSSDTKLVLTGLTDIAADSEIEAWIMPAATADHSADEHVFEQIAIFARDIVPGTGFTVHAVSRVRGDGLIYGLWNIGWVYN